MQKCVLIAGMTKSEVTAISNNAANQFARTAFTDVIAAEQYAEKDVHAKCVSEEDMEKIGSGSI